MVAQAGLLEVGVGEVVGEMVGVVATGELGAIVLTVGNTLGSGTAGVELTPRLLISKDPKGIPVRATPPGAVGEVDVGLEEAATLPEPDPHIPDIPDVSSSPGDPKVTGNSDVTGVAGDIDVVDVADIAPAPEFAAVAGVAAAAPVPPPSKLAVEPNISVGAVAAVEHAVALVVVGIVIVPVTPVGTGLTPGEVISVAPNGIPVGETPASVAMPRGEVAPMTGVGAVSVPSNCPSICATATLETNSAGRTAAISENFIDVLSLWRARSLGRGQPRQMSDVLSASDFSRAVSDVGAKAPAMIGLATGKARIELLLRS
ncbi:hypothetical protein [Bradyrhizobium sp. NP1]|uniref:hypothetical protein n=1 Tax=Bradyrhizobium sp. NP1 TaxID=3049772 RepID=UPI0025A673F4|nr:hypothetical protein [Bradyrhizobium sp. NP1]WJR77216.1 hypothetical protein QOU61_31525 [Bradyrhizobium sp. NP1]